MPRRFHLASLLEDFCGRGKDLAVVSSQGVRIRRTSYSELFQLALDYSCLLSEAGLQPGDRVVLLGDNSAHWIAAFWACIRSGVIPSPLDGQSAPDFVRRVIADLSPRAILVDAAHRSQLPQRCQAPVILLGDRPASGPCRVAPTVASLKDSDTLQIVFTSGSTADPKGIVHTHRNVLASLEPIEREIQKYARYERIFHPIRILNMLPLSHVFGQFMGLWIPPLIGAEVHFEPRPVGGEVVRRIRDERISVLASVPRILELLREHLLKSVPNLEARLLHPPKSALGKWIRYFDIHRAFGFKFWALVCGGADLPADTEEFWSALGFVVVQGYGMTETTALVALNHPFRPARGSVGQILPGREVRVGDDGEVLVRGPTVSNKVWRDGAVHELDSDWLATGDLAAWDAKGNLRFRGRKKEVIVTTAGLNIFPGDLEAALNRQPGLRSSSVIEVAGDRGPEPLAALLLHPGADAAAEVACANLDLGEFQRIRRWVVWAEPDFPRTSSGKILKREIARRVRSGELGMPHFPVGSLNLDSIGRVQLQAELEQRYGVAIDDAGIQAVSTNQDVEKLLAGSSLAPSLDHVYPRWPWTAPFQLVRSVFIAGVLVPLVRLLAAPASGNRPKNWPTPPLFIVANHLTAYDVPLILNALPRKIRSRIAVAMSGEMLLDWRHSRNQGNWLLNLVSPLQYLLVTALFNVFPVPRKTGFRRSFAHAGAAVDENYSVLVFPEGRRSEDGAPQAFLPGAGLLWKELLIAALAVRIDGVGELKSGRQGWFRSGKIGLSVVGLPPPDGALSPAELTEQLRRAVFARNE